MSFVQYLLVKSIELVIFIDFLMATMLSQQTRSQTPPDLYNLIVIARSASSAILQHWI